MITKITVQLPKCLSWDAETHREAIKIDKACDELFYLGIQINLISQVCKYLKDRRNVDVMGYVKEIFNREPSVKHYTKKKRTYSISYLTITEEDK